MTNAIKHIAKVPPLIVGESALTELPEVIANWQRESVLVVSDEGLATTGLVDLLVNVLSSSLPVEVFLAPAGEPKVATVDQAAKKVRAMVKPVVVGLGGGTALDIAKLTAGLAESVNDMAHYLLCKNPWSGSAPKIMIPTTSGTGAEVTRTCVLADERGNKSWAWGNELSPELVVLDPNASKSMPAVITVMTGLDALVHALEAATGQSQDNVSNANALQAISLVNANLLACVSSPENLKARLYMQQAAYLAGIAIDNCGTGMAHNIGHALGTLYHIPHGIAVTIGSAASLSWSLETAESMYHQVAKALNCEVSKLSQTLMDILEQVNFSTCLQRYADVDIDLKSLISCMQTPENLPMANNNSRVPQPDDWILLANFTKDMFNQLLA